MTPLELLASVPAAPSPTSVPRANIHPNWPRSALSVVDPARDRTVVPMRPRTGVTGLARDQVSGHAPAA